MSEIRYKLTDREWEAFDHLTDPNDKHILYGGAKGGGKSFVLCLWVYFWCKELIKFFEIKKPLKHPVAVGFIGRKRSVDFTKTTLETWKKVIPADNYEIRSMEKEIIIGHKVKVLYGGLDDQSMINKFNSAEYAFFAIDQAEETERGEVSVLQATPRLKYMNKRPPYKRLYTANPAECWLKEDFISSLKKAHVYIPALPSDNPYLPENYIETLEEAFAYDPKLLEAYKEGNWDVLSRDNVVITPAMIEKVRGVTMRLDRIYRVITCDPSEGGDECVLYSLENGDIRATKILPAATAEDPMKVAGELLVMSNEHKCPTVVVDGIGVGAGIVARLQEMWQKSEKKAYKIISSQKSNDPVRFANLRAEMWWNARERFMDGSIPYPEDPVLRKQLTWMTYEIVDSNGKVKLCSKKEIKERYGQSPDRADAFIYGLYGERFAPDSLQLERMARVRKHRLLQHGVVDEHMGEDF